MNTTLKGTEYEKRVFDYFSKLLEKGSLPFANKNHSEIFMHKSYPTTTSRKIICDISIETYNPFNKDNWSSLTIIECKCYSKRRVDASDFDEFESKLQKLSKFGIKGIMVTNVGFTRTEIEQARQAHIGLIVLSEESTKWIVSREVNTKPELMMPILLGDNKVGLQPVTYYNNSFLSVQTLLEQQGVIIDEQNCIDIPFLSNEVLKEQAKELYKSFYFHSSDTAGEVLANKYPEYRINFRDMPKGQLGLLSFFEKTITLSNEIISDQNRMHFTLAHEIGHLELHEMIYAYGISQLDEYEESKYSLIPDKILYRMEIQANIFASYLLMPEHLFMRAVLDLFKEHSMTKGFLFVDNQPCNQRDFRLIVGKLSSMFGVSKKAAEIRMLNENLIKYGENLPKRLNYFFREQI